jgi:hypothetical protein
MCAQQMLDAYATVNRATVIARIRGYMANDQFASRTQERKRS